MTIKGPKGGQLSMLMSARELSDYVAPTAGEMVDDRRSFKRYENAASGLDESVAVSGVQQPVTVFHGAAGPVLLDGEHRLTAQLDADPDRLIPITHTGRHSS